MPQQFAAWNLDLMLWETGQTDLLSGRWEPFSATWPPSGMTRSGRAYGLATWEPVISERVCSSLLTLPTPVAQPSANTPENHLRKKPGRQRVTDLAILVENGLMDTGGTLDP